MLDEGQLEAIAAALKTEPASARDLTENKRWAREIHGHATALLEHVRTLQARAGGSFGEGMIAACRERLLQKATEESTLAGDVDLLGCNVHVVKAAVGNEWRRRTIVDLRLEIQPYDQGEGQ